MLKNTIIVCLLLLFLTACGGGTTTEGLVTVQHDVASYPASVDHVHYSGFDDGGNRIYVSAEYDIDELHIISDVPPNIASIAVEYHTVNHEKMNKHMQSVSFAQTPNILLSPQYHGPAFDPARLAIVDESAGNLLVRGNLPLVLNNGGNPCYPGQTHCFSYNELKAKMQALIPGFDIDNYEIIDFSLIDNRGTKDELEAEINALGRVMTDVNCGANWPPYDNSCAWEPKTIYNSILAEKKPLGVVWWPVYACGSRPCNDTDADIGLNRYHFSEASEYLKELLIAPASPGKKRLIYFHCVQGTDRTGALHITYIMDNNPALNFQQAVARATIGAKQGANDQQLNPPLVPMCTYAGLAYRYCLVKNPGNPARCDMPGGFGSGATLCR